MSYGLRKGKLWADSTLRGSLICFAIPQISTHNFPIGTNEGRTAEMKKALVLVFSPPRRGPTPTPYWGHLTSISEQPISGIIDFR